MYRNEPNTAAARMEDPAVATIRTTTDIPSEQAALRSMFALDATLPTNNELLDLCDTHQFQDVETRLTLLSWLVKYTLHPLEALSSLAS